MSAAQRPGPGGGCWHSGPRAPVAGISHSGGDQAITCWVSRSNTRRRSTREIRCLGLGLRLYHLTPGPVDLDVERHTREETGTDFLAHPTPKPPAAQRPSAASDGTTGVYGITVAAELAQMSVQALRLYERKGLLTPARTDGGTRRYSDTDIARLRRISTLITDGINLTGVARVLDLEADNAALRESAPPAGGTTPANQRTPTG